MKEDQRQRMKKKFAEAGERSALSQDASNGVLPEVKITWVAVEERLPEVTDDFETMLETQQISKPIFIKLAAGRKNKETGTDEIDGYFVKRNGQNMWSLDKCGTGQYYPLELATHWRKA